MNVPPVSAPAMEQRDRDHLNLLSVFYFVFAGFGLLGICGLVAHSFLMEAIMSGKLGQSASPPPPELMAMMKVMYVLVGFLIVVAMALNVACGIYLRKRRHRIFSMVVAGLNCLQFPLGTALGVFTFIVLMRESVRESYERQSLGEMN